MLSSPKRSYDEPCPSKNVTSGPENKRRVRKVTRACDCCKTKRIRCNGEKPCSCCIRKGTVCSYEAKYARGKPPMPQQPTAVSIYLDDGESVNGAQAQLNAHSRTRNPSTVERTTSADVRIDTDRLTYNYDALEHRSSRASPETEPAEIEGQYFDSKSGLTFLHRAWKRLAANGCPSDVSITDSVVNRQPLVMAGDSPFVSLDPSPTHESRLVQIMLETSTAVALLQYYFDVCVVTYRMFHRPTVEGWLRVILQNVRQPIAGSIGHARASCVLTILAIASYRQQKVSGHNTDGSGPLYQSDEYFGHATRLTDAETGLPQLESAQARLAQVLYLLQTSRTNQAWYVCGHALQIISALGLHRRSAGVRQATNLASKKDYIHLQCAKRTFWVAYTIEKYLAVVLGRPRHYHDEDIDQDFPDSVNDENMSSEGRVAVDSTDDCHVDALIFHAKLARIIDGISSDVYSIRRLAQAERVAAAHRQGRRLHEWRENLPYHLGSVKPSSLIPSLRRQAVALRLAHAHATMHAFRPFLLGNAKDRTTNPEVKNSIAECMGAARNALETVDLMVADQTLFHAFWWTSYVTFCALAVVYVWEIQKRRQVPWRDAVAEDDMESAALIKLAERCQEHLTRATESNSPKARYGVILEELRNAARQRVGRKQADLPEAMPAAEQGERLALPSRESGVLSDGLLSDLQMSLFNGTGTSPTMSSVLDGWQTTDWLDLDSSAFSAFDYVSSLSQDQWTGGNPS
ncbi:hypothetical protein BAUCODRAFT_141759 [Baudoinia panamericana UAMH 10762]|uniref:Zn(2)-C6 fungal-type domain-containing protein n=1 Tax=Baudoinia panamericana (strain UAMH 10762) TaxID=717646 RepID=M2M9X1_BAUPA|nr:uncharacterized protein BAUCODRAFT_141759 [Baudoinia panamericana UAMH 10762]EMC93251.1 hypothetical protein BAUCODRAFT_141759 [Baudoinia panamericana UAMH 10762]